MNNFITTTKTKTKKRDASNSSPLFKKMDSTVNNFFDSAFKMTSKWKGNK